MKNLVFLMGIVLWALSPFFVYGQLLDPVDYTITEIPDSITAGEVFNVAVEASIDTNWHLYSIFNDPDAGPYPTQFSSSSSTISIAGEVEESEAEVAYDPNFETELGWHSNKAQFKIPLKIDNNIEGLRKVVLEVLYQVCDDRSCLPPKTKVIENEVFVTRISDTAFQNNLNSDEVSLLWIAEFIFFIATAALTLFFIYKLVRKKFLKKQIEE